MHELAHIALHFDGNVDDWFLDDLDTVNQDKQEQEADDCAISSLIPQSPWDSASFNSVNDVLDFAKELKIHPSIVVGRLRREKGDYTLFAKSLKIPVVRPFFTT